MSQLVPVWQSGRFLSVLGLEPGSPGCRTDILAAVPRPGRTGRLKSIFVLSGRGAVVGVSVW